MKIFLYPNLVYFFKVNVTKKNFEKDKKPQIPKSIILYVVLHCQY